MALIRIADNVCIYWETSANNPDLSNVGLSGQCIAPNYLDRSNVSCYNNGQCDGAGTCLTCTAYDVGGLKFSHKDTTQIYTSKLLYVWNSETKQYIPVRKLNPGEESQISSFTINLTSSQSLGSYNYSGLQTPMNLAIYNLRAKFQKCCNWEGPPVLFSKDKYNNLIATVYGSTSYSSVYYLPKDTNGNYVTTNSTSIAAKCSLGASTGVTDEWRFPLTTENPTVYGCNGCKAECPYYTGPKWTYCVDSKMSTGDNISAAQIMELRYYSDDWTNITNPASEWHKRFKDPVIWAWSGEFESVGSSEQATLNDNPMVRRVSIDSFTTTEPIISIGAPVPASHGLEVKAPDGGISFTDYPTLISELKDVASNIKVAWPRSTSTSPFTFRTFRIGQNIIRIFVDTPYTSIVYAANLTKNSQGTRTDSEYIDYMQTSNPDDLLSVEASGSTTGLVSFDVELEYGQTINVVKFFTRDPTSESGEYLTATSYIKHKVYHAVVAQTEGIDHVGHPSTQTWIDYFERVSFSGEIHTLTGDTHLDNIYWDTYAGTKLTMYPIEELISAQLQTNWHTLNCNFAAVTFSDVRCNSVMPWRLTGTCRGTTLRVYLDRNNNDQATETSNIDLEVYYKSSSGAYLPGNVIIVGMPFGQALSVALDPTKDRIYATYAVTEYKQGPVTSENRVKLKYPESEQFYIDTMPIEINHNSDNNTFTVDGNFIEISSSDNSESEKIYSLDDFKETVYNDLATAESQSVDSFQSGGLFENSIETSSEIFNAANNTFMTRYASKIFTSDQTNLTVEELCTRLKNMKVDEGDYKFMFVFKDEDGRPIGIKRMYMLLQSSIAETRDVEIRYKWEMTARDWVITDQYLLLARHNDPMTPSDPYGSVYYNPKCGDHSESLLGVHLFGDPGPMWYPYDRCYEPRYDVDEITDYVKCNNPVEGFTEDSEGKRWSYWERMRGPDKYRTWIGGPIFLVGCFYRDVSYTYETVDEQNFTGYTRIRSCHPYGPFSKDREALHINRHFVKRNLKVREEVITSDDGSHTVGWSDDYYQYLYTTSSEGTQEIRVGSELDTAVWVHLNDGVSIVNRTTSEAQHPFCHYLLSSVGDYQFNETYNYSSDNRYSLSEVIEDRDLTRLENRDPVGQSLLYSPEDPDYFSPTESYSDIVPVYSVPGTAWAWLERPKDPVRDTTLPITGIRLYNPSQSVWKKDRTSATYSDEGSHPLIYTPPEFNSSGYITSMPTLSWYGGPARILNWFTGEWMDSGTLYDVTIAGQPNYQLFGLNSDTSGILIDGSGYHTFIESITNDGTTYGTTNRGLAVNSSVNAYELPYSLTDLVDEDGDTYFKVQQANDSFRPGVSSQILIPLKGYYYVDKIEINYKFGPGTDDDGVNVRYDIPGIDVYGLVKITEDGTTFVNKSYLTATGSYQQSPSYAVDEGVDADGFYYTIKDGQAYKNIIYNVSIMCDHILFDQEATHADGRVYMDVVKIWYRKPVERTEYVTNYERKVNISTGSTGFPDYRSLLYYYNRTIASASDTYGYNLLLSEGLPSIKLTSKNVKDVVLEYEFYDPSGTRFAYKEDIKPENVSLFSEDVEGLITYQGSIDLCTKSRTLVAGTHVNDCPQNVEGYDFNPVDKAVNETSSCADNAGNRKLFEGAQDCLYNEATDLLGTGGKVVSTFQWFWHPDELSFWVDTVGVDLTGISPTLTLTSTVSPLYKLFQHEDFACSSDKSVPYYDGRLHYIPKWQAIGHWMYAGLPAYNHACVDVVIFKVGKHLEASFGTYNYGSNKEGQPNWPYDTYKDAAFYLETGRVEKRGTYLGGRVGGVGPAFWAAQSEIAHGNTLPQTIDQQETYEAVEGGRVQSTRADSARNGYHTDEPPVYRENSDSPI